MKRLFRGWSWEHWYNLAREDIEEAFNSIRRAVRIAVYCGIGLWVMSGFHAIRQDEVGVTTVCGRVSQGVEQPGLRYRLPWPMGAVRRVPIQRQQMVTVGIPKGGLTAAQRLGKYQEKALDTTVAGEFEKDVDTSDSALDELIKQGQMKNLEERRRLLLGDGLSLLTADHNVIQVQVVIQYLIKEPKSYLYASEGVPLVLTRAATNSLIDEAAATGVDDLLTTARGEVQSRVREHVNRQLKSLSPETGLGVQVTGVDLQRVGPPQAVAASFRAVNTAREERNTIVNQAEQYRQTVIPEAQGRADQLVSEAEAYHSNRLAEARGDASRFSGVLREYSASGELTAERLRYETAERVLAKAKKVQVGTSPGSPLDVVIVPPAPTGD